MKFTSENIAGASRILIATTAFMATVAVAQDVPPQIKQRVADIDGAVDLRVVKEPGNFTGPTLVARVVFQPARRGYKSCPDHYPARYVPETETCPDILQNASPGPGWINCHDAFYTANKLGCPPQPMPAKVPPTSPEPRCTLGAETCKDEVPGGPVLIRMMKPAVLTNRRLEMRPSAPAAASPQVVVQPRVGSPATSNQTVSADASSRARVPTDRLNIDPARLNLAGKLQLQQHLRCAGNNCRWSAADEPLTLPAPPVVPRRHVPCNYEHVSFFVFENRYCPRADKGEQPAAGAALYIEWTPGDPDAARLYYHRDDFDGVIRTLYRILGNSDDRYGLTDATDREIMAAASTAMLIDNGLLEGTDSNGTLQVADYPDWPKLCSDERFAGLPQPGFCSGVKIGDSLVATSAHCMRGQFDCDRSSVVFGYSGGTNAANRRTVATRDVYQCKAIIAERVPERFGERGADWAIFAVDRAIDAPTAKLVNSRNVEPSLVTTVIGHPIGLPSVVTRYGVVQTKASQYFIANSDTFVGNSGSAVFSAQSIEDRKPVVLGLLTGGAKDFDQHVEDGEDCVRSQWCKDPECLGDDVVYSDDLIKALASIGDGT